MPFVLFKQLFDECCSCCCMLWRLLAALDDEDDEDDEDGDKLLIRFSMLASLLAEFSLLAVLFVVLLLPFEFIWCEPSLLFALAEACSVFEEFCTLPFRLLVDSRSGSEMGDRRSTNFLIKNI